jgi:hypothetical protein
MALSLGLAGEDAHNGLADHPAGRRTRSTTMAKGQKKSNKEIRKPKKAVAKPPVAVTSSVLKPERKK